MGGGGHSPLQLVSGFVPAYGHPIQDDNSSSSPQTHPPKSPNNHEDNTRFLSTLCSPISLFLSPTDTPLLIDHHFRKPADLSILESRFYRLRLRAFLSDPSVPKHQEYPKHIVNSSTKKHPNKFNP